MKFVGYCPFCNLMITDDDKKNEKYKCSKCSKIFFKKSILDKRDKKEKFLVDNDEEDELNINLEDINVEDID